MFLLFNIFFSRLDNENECVWAQHKTSTKPAVYRAVVMASTGIFHGCETLNRKKTKKLDHFYLWCLLKVRAMSWEHKVSNADALLRFNMPGVELSFSKQASNERSRCLYQRQAASWNDFHLRTGLWFQGYRFPMEVIQRLLRISLITCSILKLGRETRHWSHSMEGPSARA